jgi:hypothetical protein
MRHFGYFCSCTKLMKTMCVVLNDTRYYMSKEFIVDYPRFKFGVRVGVLGPTAHPGLPLKVFLGVGRCQRL